MNRGLFLCVVVLISLTVVFARLAELPGAALKMDKTWIDYVADGFDGGSGTKEDPYRIATAGQLFDFARQVNAGNSFAGLYFELAESIDLQSQEWIPIGSANVDDFDREQPFRGHFDGKGNTISNLTIHKEWRSSGLFGVIRGGRVANLNLKSVDIAIGFEVGGIAGRCGDGSKIADCYVEGVIKGLQNVGGLAGVWEGGGAFRRCDVFVDISLLYERGDIRPDTPSCGILLGCISGDAHFIDCEARGVMRVGSSWTERRGLTGTFTGGKIRLNEISMRVDARGLHGGHSNRSDYY